MKNEERQTRVVGIVGLGAMGKGLSKNLAKSFPTMGFDTMPEACDYATQQGVTCCVSATEVFQKCEVVVLSLPNEEIVKSVVAAALEGQDLSCKIIIDTSTTTPLLAKDLAEYCSQKSISFLDSPVTGGAIGAERGELSIMIGGDRTAFENSRDVFNSIGNTITRIGPSGHGQVAKMVNQMLMAAIYTSVNEAFGFAVQHGADIEKIFQAVEGGGGRSMLLSKMKGPMLEGTLHNDHSLKQHGKDVRYAMKAAEQRGIELPITKSVNAFFERSIEAGCDEIWAGEMWAVWEKLFGVKFRDTIGWEERESNS